MRTVDVVFSAVLGFILGFLFRDNSPRPVSAPAQAVAPTEVPASEIWFEAYDSDVDSMPKHCHTCQIPEPEDDDALTSWFMVSKGDGKTPPMLFCCAEHAEAFFV
jgi:hypothetical protein